MDGFSVLLDAPDTPAGRLQIATLGEFKDGRYGEFSITRDDVASWQKNLALLPGQRALIDLDHSADRSPRRTEAAGWITAVGWDGDTPVADVEWTPVGKTAIEEKRYLFFSPTYGEFKDERGGVHEDTLVGGALTNKPFLTGMPAISLASEERVSEAVDSELERLVGLKRLAEFKAPATGDSRRSMEANTLIKTLGLEDGADDQKILDTIAELVKRPEKAPASDTPPKTLEQQAADEHKVLLDQEKFTKLAADAAAGRQAADELKVTKFENTFTRALEQGRAVPAQKEQLAKFYELDAAGTLQMLNEGPRIVNVRPAGQSYQLDGSDVPAGMHAAGHSMHEKVKARLKELGQDDTHYATVAAQLVGEEAA